MQENKKKFTDQIIDFVFSKDYRKYLILLILIGGLLRYLIVNNISFLGDEVIHGPHAINFLSTNKIGIMQQSVLWFYLTSIAQKIFGVTAFSTRFLSFFFGILSIIALYLLTKEIFNKKIAIIASFLLAISSFVLRYTLIEMDIAMMFFILLALYFFIKELKKNKLSYVAALLLGIAALIKSIALFFALGFGIAYFYYKYKTAENKKELLKIKDWKQGIIFVLIILLIFSPIIIYNILLYKDKGIVDVMFAKFLNINKDMYSGQAGYDQQFSIVNVFVGGFNMIKNVFLMLDPIIFILGLSGILLIYLNKHERIWKEIILIILVVPFLIQCGSALLTTHFTSYIPLLCIFAASTLVFIEKKLKDKYQNILFILLIFILILNIFFIPIGDPLYKSLTSQSANIQMRDFAINNIEDNAIVIADSRIYRGRIAWMFNDKFYLESSLLGQFNDYVNQMPGNSVSAPVYFIECAIDDCGWGTVTNDVLNQSTEAELSFFQKNSQFVTTLYGGGGYNEETGKPYYNIYKTKINTNMNGYEFIQNTHDWFYYPLNYQKASFDDYKVSNFFYRILDLIGHIVLYFSIILSILIPIYLIYLLKKDDSEVEDKETTNTFNFKNYKKYIIYILGIIFIFIIIAGYIHYSNKGIMIDHCNSLGLEMYKYANGEVYCLNKTDNSFRGFYYITQGFSYNITKEMQLHDEWRNGLK
ncbi:MAG: glycosyltransferase family 39 protein [Candidatus Nanoarchaeia archaeon]|nr:glycosyltransferase family 39 protein [Candidatus Nanoarchaeia archaeon]